MQESVTENRKIVDSFEAAKILNKHVDTIYRYARRGILKPILKKRSEGTTLFFYEDEVRNVKPLRRGRRKGDARNKGLKPWLSQHAKHIAGNQKFTESQHRLYGLIEEGKIKKTRIPSRETNSLKVLIRRGFATAEIDPSGEYYTNIRLLRKAPKRKMKKV